MGILESIGNAFSSAAESISNAFSGGGNSRSSGSHSSSDSGNSSSASQSAMKDYGGKNFLERAWDTVVDFAKDVYDSIFNSDSRDSRNISPEEKERIDRELRDKDISGRKGAREIAEILDGQNANIGALSVAGQSYVAEYAVSVWDETEDQAAVESLARNDTLYNNRSASAAMSRALSEQAAEALRTNPSGYVASALQAGVGGLVSMNYQKAKLQSAINLEPVSVIDNFRGVEAKLGEITVKQLGYEAQANLLDGASITLAHGYTSRKGAQTVVGSMFQHSNQIDVSVSGTNGRTILDRTGYNMSESWARALSYSADFPAGTSVGTKRAILENKLRTVLNHEAGRELLFDENLDLSTRAWSLGKTIHEETWTAQALQNGWDSEVVLASLEDEFGLTRGALSDPNNPDAEELALDLLQIGLDLAGIADPTGVADGANAVISIFRGDFLGAGISAVSMVPYVGDLAKMGKLGKYAETVAKAVELAATNPRLAEKLGGALGSIKQGVEAIPQSVINKLPQDAQDAIARIKNQLGEFAVDESGSLRIPPSATTRRQIDVEAGRKGDWNPILNGKLEPNTDYNVNGYKYSTDANGRVTEVSGELQLIKNDRNGYQQGKAGQSGIDGDEGGHLIASRLNGPGEAINLVPQNANFNRGAWRSLEDQWAKDLAAGRSVDVKVWVRYSDDGVRPEAIGVKYTVDGGRTITRNFENAPGGGN